MSYGYYDVQEKKILLHKKIILGPREEICSRPHKTFHRRSYHVLRLKHVNINLKQCGDFSIEPLFSLVTSSTR